MRPWIIAVLLATTSSAFAQPEPTPSKPKQPAQEGRPEQGTKREEHIQWVAPPGEITTDEKSLLGKAKAALESKQSDTCAILSDPAYTPIHARTEFRELVQSHATAKPLTIVTPQEPGQKLHVTFEFIGVDGKPLAGALLYLFHTSAKGWYSDRAAHVQANSGDFKHARLFGYVKTDEQGRAEVLTIHPAGYPNSDLPEHIHFTLSVGAKEVLASEVLFEGDPRLTAEQRKHAARRGDQIVKVEKAADGIEKCKAVFQVK